MFFGLIIKIQDLEKLQIMMKKESFLKEKHFHFFKKHPYHNGKAGNMPVAVGRFVHVTVCLLFKQNKNLNYIIFVL